MRILQFVCKPVVWTFALLGIVHSSFSAQDAAFQVKPLSEEQAVEYQLDASFYKKCTQVQDILIASSDRVSDYAHRETAYLFDRMMKEIAPKVAQRIRDRKVLCLLIGHAELTSELPQFASDKTGEELDFYNWRNRGSVGTENGRLTVVFAEEDVLEYEGGMLLESVLVHEFGHVIQKAGFDEELQSRLAETFKRAKAKGLWNDGYAAQRFRRVKNEKPVSLFDALVQSFPDESPELIRKCLDGGDILVNGKPTQSKVQVTKDDKVLIVFGGEKECYAATNPAEYWAEGVQYWFNATKRLMDHDHNLIHTREMLKAYDPGLAEFCKVVLGDSDWRFVSPRTRAGEGHLKGFDPATAPKVVKPDNIDQADQDYYDKYWKNFWKRLRNKYADKAESNSQK
jgi:hypothetical protein